MTERSHHRHNDRDDKCEYKDECNTPAARKHRRKDDLELSRAKLLGIIASAVLTAVVGTLVGTWMGGILITPDKLKMTIADNPALVELKTDVANLKDSSQRLTDSAHDIDQRLYTMNEHIANIARTTGAEVPPPKQKPLREQPAKGKQPHSPPDKIAAN